MQKINRIGRDKLYLAGGQKINISYLKQQFAKQSALDFTLLDEIIKKFCLIIKQEATLLKINDPVTVVGDIHGQYWDLIKLLSLSPSIENPNQKFLFLGDYVDRGIYGSEVTILLFCMKINYPNQIFMLRGNHESRTMTQTNNFLTEFTSKYNQALYEKIMFAFDLLPALAIINQRFFCVHGGLSLQLLNINKLQEVNKMNRVIEIPRQGMFCDLYWSDPIPDQKGQMHQMTYKNQTRGCSIFFGAELTKKFLKKHKMGMVIRAHEILNLQGFKQHLWQQTGGPVVLTIFSAPNYCGSYGNKAVILTIDNNKMKMRQFHEDKLKMQLNPQIDAVNLTYEKIQKTLDNFMKYFAHSVVKCKFKDNKKVQNLSKEDKIKLLLLAAKQQPRKKWNIGTRASNTIDSKLPTFKHKPSITDLQNVEKEQKEPIDLEDKIAKFRRSASYFQKRDALPQTNKLYTTQAKFK